mmetsp:Transcript_37718/g.58876  ORF Transcript_37718/g.58876 Transcript_37718/m.58876 type:complete len:123 (+) Transcript_37718:198-566(+)
MGDNLQELNERLERAAADAEKASQADLDKIQISEKELVLQGKSERPNPYSEYKTQLKNFGASEGSGKLEAQVGLEVNDHGVKSRVAKLRAETDLLKKCMQKGTKGDFSAFKDSVAGRHTTLG